MRSPNRAFLRRREKGVAAVEFALILPIFLTILFAIMDWGWLFFHQLVITSAAREGARAGAIATTDSAATTDARTATNNFMTSNGLKSADANVSTSVAASASPKTITVSVTFNFKPLVGLFNVGTPSQINATAVMRREF